MTTSDGENIGNADTVSGEITSEPDVSLIWAMAHNRVIGRENALPWRLPADMRHFRELTTGHPVLMGRKTFESLGRPLPGRTNIVITSNRGYSAQGCQVVHTLDEALTKARGFTQSDNPQIFVIGGANLYGQLLPYADRLYITLVDADVEGDAWFPEFDVTQWSETSKIKNMADEKNSYSYTFLTLERKKPRNIPRGR